MAWEQLASLWHLVSEAHKVLHVHIANSLAQLRLVAQEVAKRVGVRHALWLLLCRSLCLERARVRLRVADGTLQVVEVGGEAL